MLFRFSLYGFLKNQRYFEPFLLLAFLDKGLSFFQIGLLVGFREVTVNVLEIPSGAVADLFGRRRAMVVSFAAYIASFLVFAAAEGIALLFVAMALFACGDAFRTGTHKAIILDWLRRQGRAHEKTRVYGFTRSWSKIGSGVSALLAGALVAFTADYSAVFLWSIVPYAANLVNLATYPRALDGPREGRSVAAILSHLAGTIRLVARTPMLRRLVFESMSYEGVYGVVKDYLQPTLRTLALGMPLLFALEGERRAAVVVGVAYSVLHFAGSIASRKSHVVEKAAGGEEPAARALWISTCACHVALLAALATGRTVAAVLAFIALAVLQNVWRPILVARFDRESDPSIGATVMSVEAQAKSVGVMLLAPVVGFAVDRVANGASLWPVAIPGALLSCAFALLRVRVG